MHHLFTFYDLCKRIGYCTLLLALAFLQQHAYAQNTLVGLSSNGGPGGRGTAFSLTTSGANFSVIKGFEDWGSAPNGNLLKDSDGNFYGMTSKGGTYNAGSVFKMSPDGKVTVLKEFNLNVDGGYPDGELIKGADGNFYGMTLASSGYGTIFKISSAGIYTIIKDLSFADGANPHGHLTLAKDGNFYGITHGGGANGNGTIFKLTPSGVYSVIHNMNKATEGGDSYASLTEGKDGNLYGVTYDGGTFGYGTIFKVTTTGTLTVLKHLSQAIDGGYPQCDLIQATDGNFYGTCYNGGSIGYGTIFKITTAGAYTVIKNLSYSTDGASPYGGLMQNTDGNFYGITLAGGSKGGGTIYKLTATGIYSVIHVFDPVTEGNSSLSVLINGFDNNLYALCSSGGLYNLGTAFKVSTTGSLNVLANFNGASFGNAPYSTFIKGNDSAYYATTSAGGAYGFGSVIKICGGVTSMLHSFNKATEGGYPKGKLLLANDSNFYGMTSDGGTKNAGTIFKLTLSGVYSVVHVFNSPTDGGYPFGGLIQAADGLLYGMTSTGGTNVNGTIFKMNLSGSSFTVIKNFLTSTDGNAPIGDLLQATDGSFYGMTSTNAKIFKLTTAGVFTVIHSFISSTEGYVPLGSLIQGIDGNLYGTCSDGGVNSSGTIFQCSTGGSFKIVSALSSSSNGKMPKGTLLQGTDGTLYGTASLGGTYNAGTIFKVAAKQGAAITVLHQMNMDKDGGNAYGGLIFAPVNNLVANTQSISVNEDASIKITLTGSGGSPLTYDIVNAPAHGKLTGTAPNVTYKPYVNYNGSDQFSFNVSVGCLTSPASIVTINVKPMPDTPVLSPIGNKTIVKDSTLKFRARATDVDSGQLITYSLIGAPAGAKINASNGSFNWTPTTAGTYTFKVRATDNGTPPLYDEEQITVTVTNTFAINNSGLQINDKIKATIYPNPVTDKINLTTDVNVNEALIKIVDLKGTIISSITAHTTVKNHFTIDASRLTRGFYILQFHSGNISQSFRFIKE